MITRQRETEGQTERGRGRVGEKAARERESERLPRKDRERKAATESEKGCRREIGVGKGCQREGNAAPESEKGCRRERGKKGCQRERGRGFRREKGCQRETE